METERPKLVTLSPREVYERMQEEPDAVMIDVRSELEYFFVGAPVGAINIPWRDAPDWDVNPHFVEQVAQVAGRHQPIYLICRSGVRSVDAGNALIAAGFTRVFNVGEGFEGPIDEQLHRGTRGGWRFHGLPWRQC
ncbi:MAG: rhodanese-like domain-containing protein [Nitrospirae bacterium]|nr:MAG: rhodanese-like domain-containing protein [Nitrospirota bacterium]